VRIIEKYGPKIAVLGVLDGKNLNPYTQTLGNQSPPKHAIWHKNGVDPLKMWYLKADKKSYFKKI